MVLHVWPKPEDGFEIRTHNGFTYELEILCTTNSLGSLAAPCRGIGRIVGMLLPVVAM
jgi:hypothetical protein